MEREEKLERIKRNYKKYTERDTSGRPNMYMEDMGFILGELELCENKRTNEREFWLNMAEKASLERNETRRELNRLKDTRGKNGKSDMGKV